MLAGRQVYGLLKKLIPQGSKGLYIDLISNRSNEQEVLFARNSRLNVYRVVVEKWKSGRLLIKG